MSNPFHEGFITPEKMEPIQRDRLSVECLADLRRTLPECPGHATSIAQLQEEVRRLAARLDAMDGEPQ